MTADGRVVTVPNAISLARLICAPVFVWLIYVANAYGWAAALLAIAAISDWADGKLARALRQKTAFGAALDSMADGIIVTTVLVALSLKAIIPWWIVAALTLRELILIVVWVRLRHYGQLRPYIDSTGTLGINALILATPLMVIGALNGDWAIICGIVGLGLVSGGVVMLYFSAGTSIGEARRIIQAARDESDHAPADALVSTSAAKLTKRLTFS